MIVSATEREEGEQNREQEKPTQRKRVRLMNRRWKRND